MKDVNILAIESSCDETSMAIIRNGCECVHLTVLTQMDTHAEFGGVVPEIDSRMHTENVTMVLEDTLMKSGMTMDEIDAIAVTYAPGLLGSLLVGVEFAKTLSFVYKKPLIAVNHIAGHIYANQIEGEMNFPLLALLVSGGNTELILMKDHFDFEIIGQTLDDAVGEAYDKVARVCGLPYPGGPAVDRLAHMGEDVYNLPRVMKNTGDYNFSFSGLKSAVINLVHNNQQRGEETNFNNLCASFQASVVETLVYKTKKAAEEYNVSQVIIAGGVSANKALREAIVKAFENTNILVSIPPFKYCTDNAAMIAAAGYWQYQTFKEIRKLDINGLADLEL